METKKETRRAEILKQLKDSGVSIEVLPGCTRLSGAYGNFLLVTDLADLRESELRRLAMATKVAA